MMNANLRRIACELWPWILVAIVEIPAVHIIDKAIVDDRRCKVSTSECVAVIMCGVFLGHHDLWRMADRLSPYDMATIMGGIEFNFGSLGPQWTLRALTTAAEDLAAIRAGESPSKTLTETATKLPGMRRRFAAAFHSDRAAQLPPWVRELFDRLLALVNASCDRVRRP